LFAFAFAEYEQMAVTNKTQKKITAVMLFSLILVCIVLGLFDRSNFRYYKTPKIRGILNLSGRSQMAHPTPISTNSLMIGWQKSHLWD
jgi:hypothetical protein